MRSKNLILKDLQSRASQLSSDTFKCESKSHGNVQVLNLFARPFSVHVVQSVLQWGKEPIVLIKREEVSKKSNANNEPVAPKKRKSRQNAKEDKQLAKKLKEDNEGVARTARQLSELNELNAGNEIIKYKLSFFILHFKIIIANMRVMTK